MAWGARNLISTQEYVTRFCVAGERAKDVAAREERVRTQKPRIITQTVTHCVEIKFRAPHAIDATCFL